MELNVRGKQKVKRKRKKNINDENITYVKNQSNSTCLVEDIDGFIYGGFSSRFWMMRKHINSLDIHNTAASSDLPFYAW